MAVDRKYSVYIVLSFAYIWKNKIQQRMEIDKVFSRNSVKDSTTRHKFAGSNRDLENILQSKSCASPNFGTRQTVKLKYRPALSKILSQIILLAFYSPYY